MPQGSILAPILFSIFINDVDKNIQAKLHLYANDIIVYSSAASTAQVIEELQTAFQLFQSTLKGLKLALNAHKTKFMILSAHLQSFDNPRISISDGTLIERMSSYKYLGIWIDEKLSFIVHISN